MKITSKPAAAAIDLASRVAQPLNLLLLPVLLAQGRRMRATTPRLPDATGPSGVVPGDRARPLRLAVLGDSTAAGVGAARHDTALAGYLGAALAGVTGNEVRWRAVARSGATARVVHRDLVPRLIEESWRPDLVVVLVGGNDLLHYRRLGPFARDVRMLLEAVHRVAGPVSVVVAGMPPILRFPSLPQPLRAVFGLRARAMDGVLRRGVRATPGARFVLTHPDMPASVADFFGADQFHPSSAGYRGWAGLLVGDCAAATVASH